jgi:NAD-dependent dihydropyrimidine dehydrogenase PreA subunit
MDCAGIPREKIPWYPTVDPTRCLGDRRCITFCAKGVYRWDTDLGRPVVDQPLNCPVGCDGCTDICEGGAIAFPSLDELKTAIRRLRAAGDSGETSGQRDAHA